MIPYAKFHDLKKQRAHLKAARDKAKNKLRSFQANFKPLEDEISSTESRIIKESEEYEEIKKAVRGYDVRIDQFKKTQKQCANEIAELIANAKYYRTKAEQKKRELEEVKQEIKGLLKRSCVFPKWTKKN